MCRNKVSRGRAMEKLDEKLAIVTSAPGNLGCVDTERHTGLHQRIAAIHLKGACEAEIADSRGTAATFSLWTRGISISRRNILVLSTLVFAFPQMAHTAGKIPVVGVLWHAANATEEAAFRN